MERNKDGINLLLKASASLGIGLVVYLSGVFLPCFPHICPYGVNNPQVIWSAVLSVFTSILVFVFADSGKQAVEILATILFAPVFLFFLFALVFSPLSPLLLAASIIAIMQYGLTPKVILLTIFSITSFMILMSIIFFPKENGY